MHQYVLPIIIGLFSGMLARLLMIRRSYRQFPSSPHGMIIHFFIGFIASLIGSLAVPAILKPDFTAGVFFSIGAGQFHSMRTLERNSWLAVDKGELVPRGEAYIEGMAAAFEARSFLVLGVALVSTVIAHLTSWPWGLATGAFFAVLIRLWKQGRCVGDLADYAAASVEIRSGQVLVDGTTVDSVEARDEEFVRLYGKGFRLHADTLPGAMTLAHEGQRQAIVHNISVVLGAIAHDRLTSKTAFVAQKGDIVGVCYPVQYDENSMHATIDGVPLLEQIAKARPAGLVRAEK